MIRVSKNYELHPIKIKWGTYKGSYESFCYEGLVGSFKILMKTEPKIQTMKLEIIVIETKYCLDGP